MTVGRLAKYSAFCQEHVGASRSQVRCGVHGHAQQSVQRAPRVRHLTDRPHLASAGCAGYHSSSHANNPADVTTNRSTYRHSGPQPCAATYVVWPHKVHLQLQQLVAMVRSDTRQSNRWQPPTKRLEKHFITDIIVTAHVEPRTECMTTGSDKPVEDGSTGIHPKDECQILISP